MDAVRPVLQPRLSWWSDRAAIYRRSTVNDWARAAPPYLQPLVIYLVLLIIVWWRRSWASIRVLGVVLMICFGLLAFVWCPDLLLEVLAPKTMNYVDDHVYRASLCESIATGSCSPEDCVVAIGRHVLSDGKRLVGLANDEVVLMDDTDLRARLITCGGAEGRALLDSISKEP
jgi:hypothetical protein